MQDFVRLILRGCLKLLKVHVDMQISEDKLPNKAIYISNHISWLDPVILFAFLPKNPVFLLHSRLYRNKWLRFFMTFARKMEYNYIDAADAKKVMEGLHDGQYFVMFPEGMMSDSGDIMKIYEIPAIIADKTKSPLIPIWISGAQYSAFSETEGNVPHRPLPKIFVKVGKPEVIKIDAELRKNRDYLKDLTYRIMNNMRFDVLYKDNLTLFHALLRTSRIFGKTGLFSRRKIAEDINRQPQTYMDILIKSYVLGHKFKEFTKNKEHVGVIMPNTVANVVTVFGLSAYARVPVMLNFTQGESVVASMCKTAVVKHVICSKAFVEKAKLENIIAKLQENKINIHYLEDISKEISLRDKLRGVWYYKVKKIPAKQKSTDTAVILFTSGSEGMPKAVLLSHQNIIANVAQTSCFLHTTIKDLMFNSLPMFHSFGLTVGTIFPLLTGAKLFEFPSPLLYRTITELLYELRATIIVATDTFFKAYAKISHPYDFRHVHYCYAGAEAVKEDTRKMMAENLGVRLLEGYGTTECSPIVCVNTLLFNKFGTIGRLAPAIDYRIEKVPGIANGGELVVKGPNVMQGYIMADNPGVLVPVKDGWYHTGDVVEIDELGFIKIVDRVKRFVKIAGEMVSLLAVENVARETWKSEDFHCGVVAIPHPTKGEQIVFVSNSHEVSREKFASAVQAKGLSELYIPTRFMFKEEIPLFATGKADNVTLKKWVLEQSEN